jgi:hypothetical protein
MMLIAALITVSSRFLYTFLMPPATIFLDAPSSRTEMVAALSGSHVKSDV